MRVYHHTYGLETTISNCSNNYGPYQFPEKLIPLFLLNCLQGKLLPIYGDGMNVLDWLYVQDHCRGIELILNHGKTDEVYNIGGGEEFPNLSVIGHLCDAADEAFQTTPDLAKRFPNAPAAKGETSKTLKTYAPTAPDTIGDMLLIVRRSRPSWAMRPSTTSQTASKP